VPVDGDDLVFPGATRTTTTNDLPNLLVGRSRSRPQAPSAVRRSTLPSFVRIPGPPWRSHSTSPPAAVSTPRSARAPMCPELADESFGALRLP